VKVIQAASTPLRPVFPNYWLMLMGDFAASIAAGLGAASLPAWRAK
jgi:uncharacterized protein involved in exopolysaccharide biosynthesis